MSLARDCRVFPIVLLSLLSAVTAAAQDVAESVLAAERERVAAIAAASKASISVFARGGRGGGSGVVISPEGFALTNFHVVKPCGDYMQCSLPDGRLYDAVIVGIDPVGDVALIKLLGRDDFPVARIGNSDEVQVGDWCFAVGNPFLLATDFQPTVSYGLVSGVHRYQYPAGTILEYADCIQTDAAINPGNSGGPLFNARGELIGINGRGSFEKRGRVNVGVGYAISINQIKNFLGSLHSGRIVDHATMGATVATSDEGRVIVSNILESSDAYRRGLRYDDEIVAFGGRTIGTVNGFKNVLGIFPKSWRVPLSYRRDGQQFDTFVRLSGVHAGDELLKKISQAPVPEEGPQPEKKDPEGGPPEKTPPRPVPRPLPHPGGAPEAPIPEHVAKLIRARPGYANYYFNELNRDRVWHAHVAHGDFADLNGVWTLEGELRGSGPVQITLNEKEIVAQFATGAERIDLTQDLDTQLGPIGSGGLLVAIYHWQRLLTTGPQQFGDVYYLGTVPVMQREGLFDMLIGTHNVLESRFLFDPQTGYLTAMEMYPANNVDPCELYFDDYREVNGRMLPHHIQVRHGDQVFGELDWKRIEMQPGSPKEGSSS